MNPITAEHKNLYDLLSSPVESFLCEEQKAVLI